VAVKALYAGKMLGRCNQEIDWLAPSLVDFISDTGARADTASDAIRALTGLGPQSLKWVQPLLYDADPKKRLGALNAYGQISPWSPENVPVLTPMLKDPDPKVRRSAANLLSQSGADGLAALKDSGIAVQNFTIMGKMLFSPVAPLAEVLQHMEDANPEMRHQACQMALARYAGEKIVPALEKMAREETSPPARICALEGLTIVAQNTSRYEGLYRLALSDSDPGVRLAAVKALQSGDTLSSGAVTDLGTLMLKETALSGHPNPGDMTDVFIAARSAIQKAGTPEALVAVKRAEESIGKPFIQTNNSLPPSFGQISAPRWSLFTGILAVLMVAAWLFLRRL